MMIVKCFQLMSYFATSGGARFLRKWHKMLINNPQKKASKVHQVINFAGTTKKFHFWTNFTPPLNSVMLDFHKGMTKKRPLHFLRI